MSKATKAASPPGGKRKRKVQPPLAGAFMTGPQVRERLGVSHVTVHNLTFKGKKPLGPIAGRAKGGGYLWHTSVIEKFAATYAAQRNPPPGKGKKWARPAKRAAKRARARVGSAAATEAGRAAQSQKARGRVKSRKQAGRRARAVAGAGGN